MENHKYQNVIREFHNKISGSTVELDLADYRKVLEEIKKLNGEYDHLSDYEIQKKSLELRLRAENSSLDELLVEAYSLVRQAVIRILQIAPFDEQILGAIALHNGKLIEMQTGEGKTLTAVFPVYLNALNAKGCHILTFNDYLAKRDAEWMGPLYNYLGLSVGYAIEGMSIPEKKKAYRYDITYLTAKEAGFDYLRDSMCYDKDNIVRTEFNFALFDEADSILIDESRTPLIIAGSDDEQFEKTNCNYSNIARILQLNTDLAFDTYSRNIYLTEQGTKRAEELLYLTNLYDDCNTEILTRLNCALHAEYLLRKDVDYIIKNGKNELIDEFTGRIADKRRWPDELQEALEEKENLTKQQHGRILNSITLQHFVQLYPKICGMTATAQSAASEFKTFYNLEITVIPTHKTCIRKDFPDYIYSSRMAKYRALVNEIVEVHKSRRPILVGTASVKESAMLADWLFWMDITVQVLNAKNDEFEAAIIAGAGKLGAVTISTNMAGRGTDIKLGGEDESEKEAIAALGGLYVIGTNKHESLRIDNQLRGRAGRQGDPGSSRFFLSLEDDICVKYRIDELLESYIAHDDEEKIESVLVGKEVNRIQRIVEGQNFEIKRTLYNYSLLLEYQRKSIQKIREDILIRESFLDSAKAIYQNEYNSVINRIGMLYFTDAFRNAALLLVDKLWSDYLDEVAHIRESIHLSRLGGKDPVQIFRKTSIELFEKVLESIDIELKKVFLSLCENEGKVDLSALGLKIPSATWTYLVNDKVSDDMAAMELLGDAGAAANAIVLGPALIIYSILKKLKKQKKKDKNICR
jgi:preprotein translocase subunit SecA